MIKWVKNLVILYTDGSKAKIWLKELKFLLSFDLKDSFYKIMYHWYMTPFKCILQMWATWRGILTCLVDVEIFFKGFGFEYILW